MSFISELERLKNDKSGYAEFDDIALCEFLRNHADEIAELVKAANKVTENVVDAGNLHFYGAELVALKDALANLNKEKS